jgi:two-component system, chemotaxis family, protein-glutamate methylesterase/glutaminase
MICYSTGWTVQVTTEEKLKILVTDAEPDSGGLISRIAADISGTDVLDIAVNGRIALAKLRRFPSDLVLLDLAIPDMKPIDVIWKIRKSCSDTQVILLCSRIETRVDEIVEALEAGAIDFMPKPVSSNENSIREFRLRLMTIIGLLRSRRNFRMAEHRNRPQRVTTFNDSAVTVAAADIFRKRPDFFIPDQEVCKPAGNSVLPVRIDAVAIAVSTGGPNALARVIPLLPGDIGVPLLIVQHIPSLFTATLANSLNSKSAIRVKEAAEGEYVMPNIAYIAPGGRHLLIRKEKSGTSPARRYIRLNDDPPENSVRPSADVLFRSLAESYSGTVMPVIMTGMGCDGMKGVLSLKAKGCYCLSQTAETCTVYGMPRSVDEAGLSDERVPLGQIAARINAIIKGL